MDSICVRRDDFFEYRTKLILEKGARYSLQCNTINDFGWSMRFDYNDPKIVFIDFHEPESKTFFLLDFGIEKISKPKSRKDMRL